MGLKPQNICNIESYILTPLDWCWNLQLHFTYVSGYLTWNRVNGTKIVHQRSHQPELRAVVCNVTIRQGGDATIPLYVHKGKWLLTTQMGRGLNTVRATGCIVVTRAKGHVLYGTTLHNCKLLIDGGYFLLIGIHLNFNSRWEPLVGIHSGWIT